MTSPYDPNRNAGQHMGTQAWPYPQPTGEPAEPYFPFPLVEPAPVHEIAAPSPPKRRGRLVAVTAAALVLLGGATVTYVALSGHPGAASPTAAVQTLVDDLNNSDLIGVLDDLPPAERAAISKPIQRILDQLKRNDVIRQDADLSHVAGVHAHASGLTYGRTIRINNRVRIVQLTGGRISIDADAAQLPFSSDFIDVVAPQGLSGRGQSTVDLAEEVRRTGHPIRIATQQVDGGWYPSLLYTIADNWATSAGLPPPSPADRVAAIGASSPDEAVQVFVDSLLKGDIRGAIGLLSPSELAALHDYGNYVVQRVRYRPVDARLKTLLLKDTGTQDGVSVSITGAVVTDSRGTDITVQLDGSCFTVSVQNRSQRECLDAIARNAQTGPAGARLTTAQARALHDLLSGAQQALRLETTKTGGRWFLNPVRSFLDVFAVLLQGLNGDDAAQLVSILSR